MQSSRWKLLLFLLPFLVIPEAFAVQPRPGSPPREPVVSRKDHLTNSSGYIFAGTVKAIERSTPKANDGVSCMEITFHVDTGIRGVRTGQTLTVREWAGLWQAGERYRRGERLLLFLYPPSKLGLTSPVGGRIGRFKVDGNNHVVVRPGGAGQSDPAAPFHGKTHVSIPDFIRTFGLQEVQ
jgi:hypothetical protein